jgi:hypothetical protein
MAFPVPVISSDKLCREDHCQKNDGLVGKILTKAILTLRNSPAFFTNNEDDTKISINTNTSASFQVQFPTEITKEFCLIIRIFKYSFNTSPDLSFS